MSQYSDISAEKVVLATLLFEPERVKTVAQSIKASDFFYASYQMIYEAIVSLDHDGKPVYEDSIKSWLTRQNAWNETAMIDIMTSNSVSDLGGYIASIKEHALSRQMISIGARMQSIDGFDAMNKAAEYSAEINRMIETHVACDLNIVSVCDIPDGETKFVLRNWMPFPVGTVSMIGAPGGTGKSWTALQIGFRYLGENQFNKAALWLSEDPDYQTRSRAKSIASEIMNATLSEYRNAHIITTRPNPIVVDGKLSHERFWKMRKALKGYGMIILDPLRAFYGGDENSNTEANVFMGALQDWAAEDGIVIILLHHSKKNDDDTIKSKTRGASAFTDACRTVYEISKVYKNARAGELDMDNQHNRQFVLTKDNYGAMMILKDYKIMRQITPHSSARATAVQVTYQMKDDDMKFEMPEIRE